MVSLVLTQLPWGKFSVFQGSPLPTSPSKYGSHGRYGWGNLAKHPGSSGVRSPSYVLPTWSTVAPKCPFWLLLALTVVHTGTTGDGTGTTDLGLSQPLLQWPKEHPHCPWSQGALLCWSLDPEGLEFWTSWSPCTGHGDRALLGQAHQTRYPLPPMLCSHSHNPTSLPVLDKWQSGPSALIS